MSVFVFSFLHALKCDATNKVEYNVDLVLFLLIQSSDADGLGSFSPMLPAKAKEADVASGDSACCPRGDRGHCCARDIPAGTSLQCGGPHEVMPWSQISTGLNYVYLLKRRRRRKCGG